MKETLKWIFGYPNEKAVGSAASLASAMAGIFLFAVTARSIIPAITNSVLSRPVYPISCSVFLIHAAVMVAVNLTVLGLCVIATTLLGSTFADQLSLSQQRVALWYTARILAFAISIIAILWAIRDSLKGPSFSFASAFIAITAFIFALSLLEPLKPRLEVLLRWKRNPVKARAGVIRKFGATDTT